ncbi:geranylgeranyl transferas-like protein type II alpha subunit [Patellaria atrata CBS 101060]|uniref:Geranylgeranyl transferase type-2 subunit alpha n=1 Tax=Patellaria atrata CBS 101060 TaxID=1346257 RepID=A0A9P4VRS4_9PEZI|nr:geranylgeranyl transferas-like protein type II alpha subunit [Patellaria atrata CBS 101060]
MASHGVPRVSASEAPTEKSRQQELRKIEQYKELVNLVNTKAAEQQYTTEVLALTSTLLKTNPEYYTIWNYRRRILQYQFNQYVKDRALGDENHQDGQANVGSDLITTDLRFIIPLLIEYPKCYWIWNHRLWLLQQSSTISGDSVSLQLWQEELGLVGKMLRRDSRNFLGWNYRRHVVAQLEFLGQPEKESESMTETEFAYTTRMIKVNLSNFSAWHNRSKLIPKLLNERSADESARRKVLDAEFKQIQRALYTDPYDQSLWFYYQFLMSTISPSAKRSSLILLEITNYDRLNFYERELDNLRDMLDGAEDCKWIYQALLQYTSIYLELDAGNKTITTSEMRAWLEELRKLDPLRKSRWDDMEQRLNL